MTILVIATRNAHKVEEIRAILGKSFEYFTLTAFANAPEVIEDAPTFAGNATKKAVALARWLSESQSWPNQADALVLADDSGLEVDALEGAPGVHSARFASFDSGKSGNSSATENNAKLLRLLREIPLARRTARFRCVVALTPLLQEQKQGASPVCYAEEFETQTDLFDGTCEGHIETVPRGQGGFGYDPLFVPAGYEQTFGELPEEVKNRLSHRAKALEKAKQRLEGRAH
jgi:XTP/dITP diphosphohydrolase